MPDATQSTNILGVLVSPINMTMALDTIESWIAKDTHEYVCVTTVHAVIECQSDAALRAVYNAAGMVTPDGMPLVWLSRFYGQHQVERVYGPDLMLALCDRSQAAGYGHFLYGGAAGVPELLASKLRERFPKLRIVGTYSPPFRALTPDEDEALVNQINASGADIVWVGLGAPKQERWMATHVGRLDAAALIGVGAAFDFHSGLKPQAPLWMQRNGLEWLFRLLTEPRRLWKRYLTTNPLFVALALAQAAGLKRWDVNAEPQTPHPDSNSGAGGGSHTELP